MGKIQSKEWLKAGYSDLRSIKYIIEDEFLTHIVAFHSQQAIEKTLKAILEYEGKQIPKVHKLVNLVHKIDLNIIFEENIIEILDELYIESCYPGDLGLLPHGKPPLKDAIEFYNVAQNIFEQVCKILDININDLKK